MDVWEICELSCRDALDALRLLFLHWLHDALPFRGVPEDARDRRDAQVEAVGPVLRLVRHRIPLVDPHHDRCDGEPLLPRCLGCFLRGYRRLPL